MLRLGKQKSLEGWAVDVNDVEPGGRDSSLRERFADSNRLWVGSLVAVVVIALSMYAALRFSKPGELRQKAKAVSSEVMRYRDSKHISFAKRFVDKVANDGRNEFVLNAEFTGYDKFRIIVRGDVSGDEIDYVATMAAKMIDHRFRVHPIVIVDRRRAVDGTDVTVGSARWRDKKHGYFFSFNKKNTGS